MCRVQYPPVTRGGDEVQAAVHPVVRHLPPVYPGFGIEEVFKLTVDVVDDRLPAERKKRRTDEKQRQMQRLRSHCITTDLKPSYIKPNIILSFDYIQESEMPPKFLNSPVAVVHRISKAWRVDDGQRELDTPLLYQYFGLFDLKLGPQVVTTGYVS